MSKTKLSPDWRITSQDTKEHFMNRNYEKLRAISPDIANIWLDLHEQAHWMNEGDAKDEIKKLADQILVDNGVGMGLLLEFEREAMTRTAYNALFFSQYIDHTGAISYVAPSKKDDANE